jgi:purine-binding chemotaxis protein CheW
MHRPINQWETETMAETTGTGMGDVTPLADLAGQYLTFVLADETYGVAILKVQEIIGLVDVTKVPRLPDFVRGVINLRGKIIPVVDLRLKFSLAGTEDTDRTCIIVMQVTSSDDEVTMGIIVDEVSEVTDIEAGRIEPPPSFGSAVHGDFIVGMGKLDERVIMLLDVDRVLGATADMALAAVDASSPQ